MSSDTEARRILAKHENIQVELALTILITFVGRAFWITWLFMLSGKNWWLAVITSMFSLGQLGLGIGVVYESVHKPVFSTLIEGKGTIIAQMASADLGDAIISMALCFYLHRNRSGIQSTELLIDRLVMFTVTRGVLVVGAGMLQLITYVAWPQTFVYGMFHLMASKLYTNALLTTLNSRASLANPRNSRSLETGTSFVLSSLANDTQINQAFQSTTIRTSDPSTTGLQDKPAVYDERAETLPTLPIKTLHRNDPSGISPAV